MNRKVPHTLEDFNRYGEGFLFEHLGIVFTSVEATEVIAHIELQQHHLHWLIHVPVMVVSSRCPNLLQVLLRLKQRQTSLQQFAKV